MRKLNTFEMRIVVASEVWENNSEIVLDELRRQTLVEIMKQGAELDGGIEISTYKDDMREQYTIRATGRAWEGEEDKPEETEASTHVCGVDDGTYCGECEFHCENCKNTYEEEMAEEVEAVV